MNRFILPFVFFLGFVGLLYVGLSLDPKVVPSPLIGKQAPAFSLPDLLDDQISVDAASMRGQAWLLNVWGTWCPECWKEHAFLVQLSRSGVIPIIGLDWKDEADEAKQMLARMGNPFQRIGFDKSGDVAIDWGVYGAPETFLINAEGIVLHKHVGAMTPQIWEQDFVPLL